MNKYVSKFYFVKISRKNTKQRSKYNANVKNASVKNANVKKKQCIAIIYYK